MPEAEVIQQAVPNGWEITSIIIGVVGSIVTLVSVCITIRSMRQAEQHKRDAKMYRNDAYKYKTQAAEQLRCLNMYAYAESFSRAMLEITRTPSKSNNNRAGRLSVLFDHLTSVLGEITKYTTLFGNTEGKKLLETLKTQINRFIIEHRADSTVDVGKLSELFEETERLLRSEIKNYQDRLNNS